MKKSCTISMYRHSLWFAVVLVILAHMLFGHLAKSEPALRHQAENAPSSWPSKLRFGIIPVTGSDDAASRFQILGDELEKLLGIEVEIASASNYLGIIAGMKKKDIQVAYLGPYSYVVANNISAAQAVAVELDRDGNPGYHAIIIARQDSDITSLEGARNRIMAFSDPKSTSGFLVPMLHFTKDLKFLPATYFSKVSFAGNHMSVVKGVAKGTYDIGATGEVDYYRSLDLAGLTEDQFRILWTSDLIPGSPYCVSADLPPSLKAAFCGALMMMNENQKLLETLGIGGFAPVKDSDFDIVRKLKAIEEAGK